MCLLTFTAHAPLHRSGYLTLFEVIKFICINLEIKKLIFYDNDFITLHEPNKYINVSVTPTLHIQRISTKLFVVMSVARYLPCL